jgi:hypothetical protein
MVLSYMQSVRKAAIDDPIISRYMHFLDVDEMIPAEYRAASEVRKDHKYACGRSHDPAKRPGGFWTLGTASLLAGA